MTTENEAPVIAETPTEGTEGPVADGQVETTESKPKSLREALERGYDRMAEADTSSEGEEKTEEAPKQAESKEVESEKPEGKEEPEIEAPVSWSKKDKAAWKDIPKAARETIARRESERDRYIQEKGREIKGLEKITKEYGELRAKVEPYARSMKMKSSQYLDALIRADQAAIKNPLQYVEQFARNNGIDLRALVQGDREMAHDSELHQYRSELQSLRGELVALREERDSYQQYTQQQAEQARLAPMQSVIEGFLSQKPADEVQAVATKLPTFIQLVNEEMPHESPQVRLEEAYDRAIWSIPQLRQAAQERAAHAKQEAERKAAEEARRARGLRSRAPGTPSGKPRQFKSTREMLEAAWNGEI